MIEAERLRVLIVDDDEDDFIIARNLLTARAAISFDVDWAPSYEKGLDAITKREHDAYLVDYRLGEQTGIDLVRDAFGEDDAPVILLTGQAGYEVDVEASSLGFADFIDKSRLDGDLIERSIRYAVSHNAALAALRQSREELARSLDEVQSFSNAMAHDLKTPVQVIRGMAELCEQRFGEQLGEEGRDLLGRITAGSMRMNEMLDDLLGLIRLRSGEPAPTPLSAVVADALGDLDSALASCGATVETDVNGLEVTADPAQLRVALRNLIDNAIKFRRDDTPLEVSIRAERADDGVHLEVADNGTGIPANRIEGIFEIFERAHDRSQYSGTGIGLALVKKIVELNAGTISARSEPGAGTTLALTLPAGGGAPGGA